MATKSAVEALLDDVGPAAQHLGEYKPDLPKTKGEVGKLSSEQMDVLVEAHGLGVGTSWDDASTAEKHKILNVALGFVASKKGKADTKALAMDHEAGVITVTEIAETVPLFQSGNKTLSKAKMAQIALGSTVDPLTQAAQDIENLKDQTSIEGEIGTLLKDEGLIDFRLGGLLRRLMEVGTFPDNASFIDYIGERWGLKYRKARYMIELYNGLLKSGVAWETVAGLGWSKVIALLPVLTPENVAEWVEKANAYNVDTLQATVQAALATGDVAPKEDTLQASKLKTITFNVGPDQEDLIGEALKDAMKKGQTEHKGVALELICTEYLGSVSGMKPVAKTTLAGLGQPPVGFYEPKAIFKHFLDEAKGDRAVALTALFGEAFDEVFVGVEVTLEIKE